MNLRCLHLKESTEKVTLVLINHMPVLTVQQISQQKKILQDHLIKMHSDHFKCHLCPKIFALEQSQDLKLHMFKHEMKLLANRRIECVQCGNFFGRPNKYQEHVQKKGQHHNDQCAQCPRKFTTHEEYKTHVDEEHY